MNKETTLKVIANETLDEIADRIVELYKIIAVYYDKFGKFDICKYADIRYVTASCRRANNDVPPHGCDGIEQHKTYNEWERLQCDYRDPVFCIDSVNLKPKIDN